MVVIRTHYVDASAIVKLLVDEDGSSAVRAYHSSYAVFWTTALCFSEVLGVLKTKYVKKLISSEQYFAACEELMTYLRDEALNLESMDISKRYVFDEVELLGTKYSLDVSDAFQLVTLKHGDLSRMEGDSRPILITADRSLAMAARVEGLRVWDCLNEAAP